LKTSLQQPGKNMPYHQVQLKKAVLISSGQPSLNPRLVKEADALTAAGYSVMVLYAYWNEWGTQHDKQLLAQKGWKAICTGGDPVKRPLSYLITRIKYKLAHYLYKRIPVDLLAEYAAARSTQALTAEATRHHAHIYIAHTLGALPAAVKAAKKQKAKCGFDAEDFHRNEVSDNINSPDYRKSKAIEDKYLPWVDYLTASSSHIAAAYKKLYPQLNPVTIKNVFAVDDRVMFKEHEGNLKLLWFSQTIGPKRGLDDVFAALQLLKNKNIELHLLGHLPDGIQNAYLNKFMQDEHLNLHLHEPMPAKDLIAFAAQFDIGLALEPGFSRNNSLALSNKIFTYLLAGLAVLASNTAAQQHFISQYPDVGRLYQTGDVAALSEAINFYDHHRHYLLQMRRAAFRLSHEELNWETESRRFVQLVNQTLSGGE
jgi:glycosyltransferase involved in cell wall biosynthesis